MKGRVLMAAAGWIAGGFLMAALNATNAGAQGATTQATKFGAWTLQCERPPGGSDQQCGLIQIVRAEENQKVATAVIIRKSPAPSFEVIAPEGVLLPEGVKFKIGQSDIGQLPFIKCIAGGCVAQGILDDSLADKLKSGHIGLVTIYMNPGEGLRHLLTLDGFKEGYEALK